MITTEKSFLYNPEVLVRDPDVTATAGEVSRVSSALLGNSYFFPPDAIKLVYLLKGFKLLLFLEIKYLPIPK